jgi:polyisoprenoid-binding protein YceI
MQRFSTVFALTLELAVTSAIAAPETYQLEKTHVDLLFAIDHAGFSQKHGSFRELEGTLVYDAQTPSASHVKVTVKTDSLDTGFAARDTDVKGPKFLDAATFPEMIFESTKVARTGNKRLRIEGELTLHGITKPIVLDAKLNRAAPSPFDKRPTVGFSASGTLKRSDFGIAAYIPLIGDIVTITIDAEFNHPAK